MKVLVTGGTGFVGTHLVNRLLHRGHSVAVLARDLGKTRNRYNRPVEAVGGDVLAGMDALHAHEDGRRGAGAPSKSVFTSAQKRRYAG